MRNTMHIPHQTRPPLPEMDEQHRGENNVAHVCRDAVIVPRRREVI